MRRERDAEKVRAYKLNALKRTLEISLKAACFENPCSKTKLQQRNMEGMRLRIDMPGEMNRAQLAAAGFY